MGGGLGREIFETSPNFAKRCNMMCGDPGSAAEPSAHLHQAHTLTLGCVGSVVCQEPTVSVGRVRDFTVKTTNTFYVLFYV